MTHEAQISMEAQLSEQPLLPHGFVTEIGSGEYPDGTPFELMMCISGSAFYLRTKYPHPDEPQAKVVAVLPMANLFTALANYAAEFGPDGSPSDTTPEGSET